MDVHSHTIGVVESTPDSLKPPRLETCKPAKEQPPVPLSPSEPLSEGEVLERFRAFEASRATMQRPEPLSPSEQLSDSIPEDDPEPLTTSALARLERHLGSRQADPPSTGYKYADIDRLSHQAVMNTGGGQIRSTDSLGFRVKTLEDAAARTAEGAELTPKGKLQRRKDIARTKIEVEKRQRMLDTEMKKIKERLAEAEAKAEKEAVGEDAMYTDNA